MFCNVIEANEWNELDYSISIPMKAFEERCGCKKKAFGVQMEKLAGSKQ